MTGKRPFTRMVIEGTTATAVLMIALGTTGCTREEAIPVEEGNPYLRGVIQSLDHRATGSGILVLPFADAADSCGIRATADAATVVEIQAGTELRPAAVPDLQPGDTVEVYVEGPVAESCPAQGRAGRIVRIPPPFD